MPKIPKPGNLSTNAIKASIKARKLANDLIQLGVEYIDEEGLPTKYCKRFWQEVVSLAAALVGEEFVCQKCRDKKPEPSPVYDEPYTALTDADPLPCGKRFKGQPLHSVPDWHLEWLYSQDWVHKKHPGLVEYIKSSCDV